MISSSTASSISSPLSILQKGIRYFVIAPLFILLTYTLLFLVIISPALYTWCIGAFDPKSILVNIFILFVTILCFFVLPFLMSTFLFRLKPRELGLYLPEKNTRNLLMTLLPLIVLLMFSFLFARQKQFQAYYAYSGVSAVKFMLIQLIYIPIYYIAEEFFFRGFLFLILWRIIGWHSFWITDAMFIYAHLAKPIPELILSFPVGIFLSYITLKTKSIYPAILAHTTMGIALNSMVYFR